MTTLSYEKRVKEKDRPRVGVTSIMKVLSNASRYAIMEILFTAKRDLCVHEIAEIAGMSQSATSHQLAYLEARGVVEGVRMGKTKCYLPTNSTITKRIQAVVDALK